MRLLVHVWRLVTQTLRFGASTRQWSFVVLVLAGLVLVALVIAAQFAAPLAVYPFA